MTRKRQFKALFYLNIALVAALIGYKGYLNLSRPEFTAVHTEQLLVLRERLGASDSFSFAVVGNINNSVGVFERAFIPLLNKAQIDFLVSAGNAVSAGGEDKYRALYGTLSHLNMPYLLTFGPHEYANFGSFRFYEHFGPHFYSMALGDSRLIFLDSTGKTHFRWQLEWLSDLLDTDDAEHTFVFISHPPLHVENHRRLINNKDFLAPTEFAARLMVLVKKHRIDAVFSANLPIYSEQDIDGARFITTGGAGGLIRNNDLSFYHYVRVHVSASGVTTELVPIQIGQHPLFKQLESLWFFIYSLFYVGLVNFLLILGVLSLIAMRLYTLVFVGHNYYRNFDLDPAPWIEKPLRVAMFTNNYLPFIGGVPVSIERLRNGLQARSNAVLIVAPRYKHQDRNERNVIRLPSLLSFGARREFKLANIFVPGIYRKIKQFKPDIIHLHHPIWVGSLGLFIGRRLGVPVVYTYHTRLEHYAHFVPLPGKLFRNLISHLLIKRFANKCDGIVVPTYSAEEYLRMIGVRTPIFVQPTGVDFQRFQTVDENALATLRTQLNIGAETILISVARLSNEKNIDFMIDAVQQLRRDVEQPFRLLMIGDGHQRQRLQNRIDQLQLGNWFSLIGAVEPEKMPTYYRLGDVFVFASQSETQGMVILEAMAAALPVVAIRSSGIDDVIDEGVNGFKTADSQRLWQAAVKQLIGDARLRQHMARNALESARMHSIEHFALEIKGIYARMIAQKST
ncbi:glycosyltransferase [Halopseudomonas pelagia]|uniref:glycosyltransferase n=1 Tax=Halopseudomonas pelagia TaxID=553151 RepID=UPI0003B45532|nr:glycosyltransferase [Halopseudomonas pelagia]|tara:strand:- start:2041 stop:4251 length:2211 start_codon:yes stop_codon:yes gene_type:complete